MPMEKQKFNVVEASIDDLHSAIKSGEATLVEVVRSYIERVKAYNGVSCMLVTEDGSDIAKVPGVVRGGQAIEFPTKTIKADDVLPNREN